MCVCVCVCDVCVCVCVHVEKIYLDSDGLELHVSVSVSVCVRARAPMDLFFRALEATFKSIGSFLNSRFNGETVSVHARVVYPGLRVFRPGACQHLQVFLFPGSAAGPTS